MARNRINRKWNSRCFVLLIVLVLLFAIMLQRLWELQILEGESYAENYELKITRTIKDNNVRGNIYDRNGEVLAYNKLVYTVTMVDNGTYASEREHQLSLNGMIYKVMKKLEENGEQINNELKIIMGENGSYEYTVTGKSLERFKADIFGEADPADMSEAQRNMSAEDMVSYLSGNSKFALYGEGKREYSEEELQEYGLPKEYTKEEALNMVGIRYMLSLNVYRKYVPVVFAGNVSEEMVAYIKENNDILSGIDIGQEWERVYDGGEAFSHILGYVGKISAEELEMYEGSEKGYTADSIIGKTGIEQYLEHELQGIDGERQILVNNVGRMVGEEKVIRETVSGRDVYLSIDKELQITVYNILEQHLAGIIASNLINAKEFDKSHIADTTDIRIPIYDVYIALFENHVIQAEELYRSDATEVEQGIAERLEKEKKETIEEIRNQLSDVSTNYRDLTEKMQAYESYIVDQCGIIEESLIDKEDKMYIQWKNGGDISMKEFLLHSINSGWIRAGVIESDQGYLTTEERFEALVTYIEEQLYRSSEFQQMIIRYMILEDKISGTDICKLLYEQEILPKTDEDYEKLLSGSIDTFSFLKRKIEKLEITPAQLALDPCSASAVVVQAETGKVLACVSYPGYDNNQLANQIDAGYYSRLLSDRSLPLYNRATQQLTAPGSTFKPITIIAGLEEGVIAYDTSVYCDGVFDRVMPNLKCWNHSGHGNVTDASTALQFSCNDYLCEIAYRLGTADGPAYDDSSALSSLQKYAELFYLDKKSGIEIEESLPHVTDAYGIQSAIGQGTNNYTTVQLARYINSIATEGDVFPLSLVKGIVDADGGFVEAETALSGKIQLSDSVWNTVRSGMVQFAQNNSVLKDMEISVAGKTGTAQEAKTRPDHALFVGYAPAEEPEITIAVRIANGYGSSNATMIGKNIWNYYFGLEKQEDIMTGKASSVLNVRTD